MFAKENFVVTFEIICQVHNGLYQQIFLNISLSLTLSLE